MIGAQPFRYAGEDGGGVNLFEVSRSPGAAWSPLFGPVSRDYTVRNPLSPYSGLQMRGLDAGDYEEPSGAPLPTYAAPLPQAGVYLNTPAGLSTGSTGGTSTGSTGGTSTGSTGGTSTGTGGTVTGKATAPAAASLLEWWSAFRASKYFWPVLLIAAVLIFGSNKQIKLK